MTDYVITPPAVVTVPTCDAGAFPVTRIFCIGKNYADHVKEMGGQVGETPPVFFTKYASAVICPTDEAPDVPYPPQTNDLHYEAEIVLALKSGGRNLDEATAMDHVWGVGLGCDFTRRDRQAEAKKAGSPWDMAKNFDGAAVMGTLREGALIPDDLSLSLLVNSEERQRGTAGQMIFSPARILARLSSYLELRAGDLIYTGTPAGVGAVGRGDQIVITGTGLPDLSFKLV